jgi:hypothetical protein
MHDEATEPIRYCVVVRGRLGREVAGTFALERFELEVRAGASSLTATFADRAQLHGLLDRLRDLGIPIVSVNPVT